MEQGEEGKIFKEKRNTRKWSGVKSYIQGDNRLRYELKGIVPLGQDPTHLSLQYMKRN